MYTATCFSLVGYSPSAGPSFRVELDRSLIGYLFGTSFFQVQEQFADVDAVLAAAALVPPTWWLLKGRGEEGFAQAAASGVVAGLRLVAGCTPADVPLTGRWATASSKRGTSRLVGRAGTAYMV